MVDSRDAIGIQSGATGALQCEEGQVAADLGDDSGNVIEFVGEAKEDVMAYEAESVGAGGVKLLQRMTFTKISDNRVRQLWEQSSDGGKTWSVAFDGDYRRKT